jgi:DNA-binding NarL/FixJ family response regulator
VIADDQRLVRTGFRVILGADGIDVVGEAADGVEAVEQAVALSPDVVLMDVRMPKLDGLQATRLVLARTSCRVLILTTFDSDDYVYEALRSGPVASCSRTRPRSSCSPRCGASRPVTH